MRLIDAEEAIRSIVMISYSENDEAIKATAKAIYVIEHSPTIEPEWKKGKWIKLYAGNYKCSVCGDWWGNDNNEMVEDFKYCPNCGARMGESNG